MHVSPGAAGLLQVIAQVDDAICTTDTAGIILKANASFARLTGSSSASLEGASLASLLSPGDAPGWQALLAKPAAAHPALRTTLGPDSEQRISVDLRILSSGENASGPMVVKATPTNRRRASDAVNPTLLELSAILDNASVGILFTRDRTVQRCNQRMAEIFGYLHPRELIGKPAVSVFVDAESYERLVDEASPLLPAGRSFHSDWLLRRADGSPLWCNIYGRAVDPARTELGTVWVIEDITESKRTGETLRKTLREMEAIMRNAPVGVVFTRDRRIVRCNAKFSEIFRFEDDSAIGAPGRSIYRSDEEYDAVGKVAAPLLSQGEPFQTEMLMRRQDGTDIWVNLIGYVQNREDPSAGTIWIAEDRTAFKRTEEALARAYAEQHLILDHSVVGIAFVKNRRFQRCNRRLEEIYGYGSSELEGLPTRVTFLSDETFERLGLAVNEALARGETFSTEMIQQRRDGEPFWVRITGKAIDPAHPEGGSIWNLEDITVRKMAEDSLRESETLQRAILDSASLIILSTDRAGRIVSCNPAAERMLGMSASRLVGSLPTDLCFDTEELEHHRERLRQETGIDSTDTMAALCARAQLGQIEEGEWTFCRSDGTRFPVQLSVSALRQGESQVKGFLLVAGDITERKLAEALLKRSHDELEVRVKERTSELQSEVVQRRRAEERLKYLALHDSLTGLPNRSLLRQRIAQTVEQVSAFGRLGAVLFVDLDRFKNINDTLGHHLGDALLKEVARRIASAVRVGDSVARLGGDEFVVVASAIEEADHALVIAHKIRDSLRPGFHIGQHELFVTPSIGIALIPRDGDNGETLLRHADTAMYQAKATGRNTVCFFDPSMTQATERYLKTESSLRRAIDRGEFEPYYQPVVSLEDGSLVGLELLLRWRHPELGLVMPANFIPIAEESGLVAQIGTIVLESACQQLRAWHNNGLTVPKLAINLSAVQFRERPLIESIMQVMAKQKISPSQIELEITETALMQDGEKTLATLQCLADAGFSLAVDDFGTGYSSLAYLKRFPVSKLKIDRSFILDMTKDPDDEAIVQTIISLAKTLRLSTTAEGVETVPQRDALRRFGCDFAQGYLFARPMPAAQLEIAFLGQYRAAAS